MGYTSFFICHKGNRRENVSMKGRKGYPLKCCYMEYILKGKEKIERSVVSKRRNSSMDVKRVKQILSSSSRIDVTYEGVPVWIESCDEQSGVAQVYDVSNPGESVHVNVTALEEK